MNVFKALDTGYSLLKLNKINSYKIDTELLLSASLNISKEKLFDNMEIVSVAEVFAKAVNRIHNGQSVSALFQF